MSEKLTIPMDDYDWREVFACSGDVEGVFNSADVRPAPPTSSVSIAPFGRTDVSRVFGMVDGERDESDWLVWGRLKDRRFFFIAAGCDYTGWDCQSGGAAFVSFTRADLVKFGMSPDERQRLGIKCK